MKNIIESDRLKSLPPYIFAKLEQLKEEYSDKGLDIIDFGVGDPDFPTPKHVINSMKENVDNPLNHSYPSFKGEYELRKKISLWYKKKYNVDLDPEEEVLILLGSKEGIAHLPLAFVNDGEYALVPDPGYPAYLTSILLAGGIPYLMPLEKKNRFLPVLEDIPTEILSKTKMMFLNYPNNPTSAVANLEFFNKVTEFASKHSIIICHDFAYSEVTFDDIKAVSFLSSQGSREIGIELHSFSKSYNMTGWRIGFAVGNKKILAGLSRLKSCVDSGVFKAIQYAGITALEGSTDEFEYMMNEFTRRRNTMTKELKKIGWEFEIPKATYYFWVKIPEKYQSSSLAFTEYLLKEKGLIVTPGIGFGKYGEGYIRMAINLSEERIKEAFSRLVNL